jgi:hypothetical protein
MGGSGSTRWGCHRRKLTVEECLVLDLDAWIEAGLLRHRRANIEWTSRSGNRNALPCLLEPTDVPYYFYLYLFFADSKGRLAYESITLLSRPQTLGGVRWYFFCPRWCGRRVRKLYMGPGKSGFACRTCLGLTYQSAQEHDKKLDIFRRDPDALEAGLEAGTFYALKFFLTNVFRVPRRRPVTITPPRDSQRSRVKKKPE